jgi:hypothetical protein
MKKKNVRLLCLESKRLLTRDTLQLDSVFRVLEPVIGKINERTKAQPTIGSRFGLRSQRSEWFRVYRVGFTSPAPLLSEALSMLVSGLLLAIGFVRLVVPESKDRNLVQQGFRNHGSLRVSRLSTWNRDAFIDTRAASRALPSLRRRTRDWRSLQGGASRVSLWGCSGRTKTSSCSVMTVRVNCRTSKRDELTVHTEFGLYVDKHGDPSRRIGTIEWEGTAERIAWHPPYILLFDSRFIEIRHVETGRLVQIISGNDMRCTWDGRGTNHAQPVSEGPCDEIVSQEPRVHGVMNMEVTQPGRRGTATQHVFELIPTVPLFLPGSLASPSHASYFNQSNSPPHSPRLNPAYTIG